MRTIIYPYRMYSQSSRQLRDHLNALRVFPDRRYRPRRGDFIINWGNSIIPNWYDRAVELGCPFLNDPTAVSNASNKSRTLNVLSGAGVSVPDFTNNVEQAYQWLAEGTHDEIYVRWRVQSHGGRDIEIISDPDELPPNAPLYVGGINPKAEYRVHVFQGEVIDYTKKRRIRGDEPTELQEQIRSHDNGWIFTRGNLRRLERIEQMAVDAVQAIGLDFGAVDIIRDRNNVCYVLEVNTAIGMEGTTLETYINRFNTLIYG